MTAEPIGAGICALVVIFAAPAIDAAAERARARRRSRARARARARSRHAAATATAWPNPPRRP